MTCICACDVLSLHYKQGVNNRWWAFAPFSMPLEAIIILRHLTFREAQDGKTPCATRFLTLRLSVFAWHKEKIES